ncbi:polyphenol oxidase protein [Dioscorea alata]|uniref:Polyphenol oxidase protein n=1 Tax=Dioscorea alata TaxID=55571 RepID=A0ACB7VS42_DIOAL|nr:polyphenol oxidase protein [Dioscorea alata]
MSLYFHSPSPSACPLEYHPDSKHALPSRSSRIRCALNNNDMQSPLSSPPIKVDRRDMLLGLGGLYGATTGMNAHADPIMPPDPSSHYSCKLAVEDNFPRCSEFLQCCPPYQDQNVEVTDYTFPKTSLRVRRPIQDVANDSEYMEKYKTAIQKMKALPETDPRNFIQQSKIHCAYCNEALPKKCDPNATISVHNSWIFLPWHRYYLHFFERILGKLIGDDTFALPYWNFDNPNGMTIPSIFTDPDSPLYDDRRDTGHYPPKIVDYKYKYTDRDVTDDALIAENLAYMSTTFKEGVPLPELFMGDSLRAMENPSNTSPGQMEVIHNSIHMWVGESKVPHRDMGTFVTAARDCIFYALHANVDRLWSFYRALRSNRYEFKDRDWLDATFIFFNEDGQVVRVKIEDSLNASKLCYTYKESPAPWLGQVAKKKTKVKIPGSQVQVNEFGSERKELDKAIQVLVKRPKKSRSKSEKENEGEVLFIQDIIVSDGKKARFDVYIDAPAAPDRASADNIGEFAGSFVKLPDTEQAAKASKDKKRLLKLGISSILEDFGIEDADNIVVTIVPQFGSVSIGGVFIKLIKTDVNSV